MDAQKITFKHAAKTDKKLVCEWMDMPHVKEYWGNSKKRQDQFESYLKGADNFFDYWICYYDKKPYGLILTADASKQADHLIPWIEPEGTTLTLDFIIGEESFLGKKLSYETLKRFAETRDPPIVAFLIDPEVKNERAIHVCEKAGFTRVSTFIRGQGFFKGSPHYLFKLKIR